MQLTVGQMAPEFALYSTDKEEIKLSNLKGKNVVLLFFPAAFTGVCTKEMCETRDNISFYNKTNALVYGISVDMLFSLDKFKEEQKLNFPLLTDFNKTATNDYGTLLENFAFGMNGVSNRAAFVIDTDGKIAYAEYCPTPGDYPNFENIQKTLSSLI